MGCDRRQCQRTRLPLDGIFLRCRATLIVIVSGRTGYAPCARLATTCIRRGLPASQDLCDLAAQPLCLDNRTVLSLTLGRRGLQLRLCRLRTRDAHALLLRHTIDLHAET